MIAKATRYWREGDASGLLLRRGAADYDDYRRPYTPQTKNPLVASEGLNARADTPPPVDLKLSHNVTVKA